MAKGRVNDAYDDDPPEERVQTARARAASSARQGRAQPRLRGRSIVAVLLIGFVLVASAVIWRRSYGITHSRTLSDIERQRVQYESEVARLRGAIRDESSRWRLGPVVERLGMHVPGDAQVRIIPQ